MQGKVLLYAIEMVQSFRPTNHQKLMDSSRGAKNAGSSYEVRKQVDIDR